MLMSKAEYAKHRGVSRQTVYNWIECGSVVMSGKKIDVAASELLQQQPQKSEEQSAESRWPHRTLEMTWSAFWDAVKAQDGKVPPPVNAGEIESRVRDAADEMNWEVEFLEDGGICLDDGDAEYYFDRYTFSQNADLAIGHMRREVCYVVDSIRGDKAELEIHDWSPAGLKALAKSSTPA
ncbi:hypothetical protein RY966_002625 [Enterobacter kobei]|nr:hypothetical protein [Enterobacter kobei]